MSTIALAKAVGALAVAGLTGLGGYNYATNGCFLKMGCSAKGDRGAAVLPVANAPDPCPLGCSMTTQAVAAEPVASSCCSGDAPAAVEVAQAKSDSCCSGEPASAAVTTLVATEATDPPACCEGGAGACCEAGDGACCSDGKNCCASEG